MITSADIEMNMLRRMSEMGANTGKGIAYAGDSQTYFLLLNKYLTNKHFDLLEKDIRKGNRRLALQRTQALMEIAENIGILRTFCALSEMAEAIEAMESATFLLRICDKIKAICKELLEILDEPRRFRDNQKANLFGIQDFCFVEQ